MPSNIPGVQQAWRAVGRGTPSEALRFETNVPVPRELGEGEVLVKIHAASISQAGWKIMRWMPWIFIQRPYTPEFDFAGVVVDHNNTHFSVGDKVFGTDDNLPTSSLHQGTLAQYIRIPASKVLPLPSDTTPSQASGIPGSALTAYRGLFEVGGLEAGQSVFINGGSSSVGIFAIQLAKAKGCRVVASASGKNEELVRSLGADDFIDYTLAPLSQTLSSNPQYPKFNLILDAVGLVDPSLYTSCEAYLAPNGIFVSTGPQPQVWGEVLTVFKLFWNVSMRPTWLGGVRRKWTFYSTGLKPEVLETITQLVSDGKVKPIVDSVYPFEDVVNAYEHLMTYRAGGKVIVMVDREAN
ncbi:hypothetical protein JAAARDRAFT_33007 [Jaapia argillacea MUCL 33604]|uniref:Enoyl reductase (ER) domain-containing protein n=1 Tax=Jaapia argillacea MUCL 33604 TaxID=933084 RepID=A0A067PXB5_9AGAM|nr:hypothetical protein JAAARDRAFT_33007 [Jaapia argillacea MUCL 33604]